jgi:uncharacterized protein YjbI with pentapeptide repeats
MNLLLENYKVARRKFISDLIDNNPDVTLDDAKEIVANYIIRFKNLSQNISRDISDFIKSDFANFVNFVEKSEKIKSNSEIKNQAKNQAILFTSDGALNSRVLKGLGNYLLAIPLTQDASKFYGMGTNWCTKFERKNQFNNYFYRSQGFKSYYDDLDPSRESAGTTLFYFIDRSSDERYAVTVEFFGNFIYDEEFIEQISKNSDSLSKLEDSKYKDVLKAIIIVYDKDDNQISRLDKRTLPFHVGIVFKAYHLGRNKILKARKILEDKTFYKFEKDSYTSDTFENTKFVKDELSYKDFSNCKFDQCNFNHSKIKHSKFDSCIFKETHFTSSDFENSEFINCKFDDLNIRTSNLSNVLFKNIDLVNDFILNHSSIRKSDFNNLDFKNTLKFDLSSSKLDDVKFKILNLNKNKTYVNVRNTRFVNYKDAPKEFFHGEETHWNDLPSRVENNVFEYFIEYNQTKLNGKTFESCVFTKPLYLRKCVLEEGLVFKNCNFINGAYLIIEGCEMNFVNIIDCTFNDEIYIKNTSLTKFVEISGNIFNKSNSTNGLDRTKINGELTIHFNEFNNNASLSFDRVDTNSINFLEDLNLAKNNQNPNYYFSRSSVSNIAEFNFFNLESYNSYNDEENKLIKGLFYFDSNKFSDKLKAPDCIKEIFK